MSSSYTEHTVQEVVSQFVTVQTDSGGAATGEKRLLRGVRDVT